VTEPSVPLSLFRVVGAAGRKGLFRVQACERKIGLAALVPRVEPDKTECPGTAAARFAANEGEVTTKLFEGGSTRRASSHSPHPSEHDLIADLRKFLRQCGNGRAAGHDTGVQGEFVYASLVPLARPARRD
jgi:hypothetical protein